MPLIAAAALRRGGDGLCALDHVIRQQTAKGVQLLLGCVLRHAPAATIESALLTLEAGSGHNSTLAKLIRSYPAQVANVLGDTEAPIGLEPYEARDTPNLERVSAAALDAVSGRMALAGHHASLPPEADLWSELKGSSDSSDAVDVTCGLFRLPGLVAGPKVGMLDLLVEAAKLHPRLIVTEPLRAAIDFEWKAFGRRLWLQQVLIFVAFAASYIVGLMLLLLEKDEPTYDATPAVNMLFGDLAMIMMASSAT